MKGGNAHNEIIDPYIMIAVTEYIIANRDVTIHDLVMEVPKLILPEIPLYDKRVAICQMRLQHMIKFDGFKCSV